MFKRLDTLNKVLYLGAIVPLFTALTTPLWVNSQFLFPFITTKVIFFRVLIEIALSCYVLLAVRESKFRPRWTQLTIAVSVFFTIITIASLFGINFYKSFWGNIERGEGLLTLYHVFAFFFLLIQVFKSKQMWHWFINVAIFVSVITGVYALLQYLDSDSVINGGASRLSSTIGNAAFYAGYLAMNVILSVWMFVKQRNILWRLYYGAVILFELFILVETETRGAFLGLLSAVILSSLIYAFLSKQKNSKKIAIGIILGIVVLSGLIFAQKDSSFVQEVGILRRITTISFNDITTQSRLLTWDSSWQGLKDRPLLGYGVENYNVAFNKYFHAEIFRDAGSQIWFDRAHNIVFDIAVTSGIVGLLSYLAIFIFALKVLYRHMKKTGDIASFALSTGFLSAYFIQNLFVFDVLATYITFFLFLAFIVWIEQGDSEEIEVPLPSKKISPYFPVVVGCVVIILAGMVVKFNIEPAQANITGVQALILDKQGNKEEAFKMFRKAIDYNTNQSIELRQRYAELVMNQSRTGDNSQAMSKELNRAIIEIKKSIEEQPENVQHYLFLMMLYNASDQFDANRSNLVLSLGEKALELSPTRPQIYYEIGQAYIAQGKNIEAVNAFESALKLQPKSIESQWNLTAAYYLINEVDKAQEQLDAMIENGYNPYTRINLQRRISVLALAKNWNEIIKLYKELIKLDPENSEWVARLAATYKQSGNNDKARETAILLRELDSSTKAEVDKFLESLSGTQEVPVSPVETLGR